MYKLKYSAIAASGAVLLMLGVTVSARAAIAQGGLKSWAVGITLMLGGFSFQTVGLKRLLSILSDEEVDRILRRRSLEFEEILEQRRLQEVPTACRGCQNYHGKEYGGVMLVCAVHPEGVEGDSCPDHQKTIAPKN